MHTIESIKALLDQNPKAVERALMVLFNRQEADERSTGHTSHLNGRGFNGFDAPFGTDLAKRVLAGGSLSERQLLAARRMVKKYARQLLEEAQAKSAA